MKDKKVRFIDAEAHQQVPEFYPPVGTIGKVIKERTNSYFVDWGKDSGTFDQHHWYCSFNQVEAVEEEMQEENPVWKMLEPKMTKNGFNPADYPFGTYYYSDDVHKMVELAYTCGYRRAKRGKPFEYGKKNKNKMEDVE